MIVRKANEDDAEKIIYINVLGWRNTYKDIFSIDFLNNLDLNSSDSVEKCKKKISQYIVCELNGEVVGFVRYGKNRKNLGDEYGEIYAIYLLEEYKRKGIGTELVNFAFNELKKDFNFCVISTLTQNPANGFYKKLGGKLINICDFKLEENVYKENIYEYELNN